jgi:hypothetical protein
MATTTVAPAVTHIDLTTFRVESSQGGWYLVRIQADGFMKCGCKAGAWGNSCRHATAVHAHLLAVTGADAIAGLRMPHKSIRSTGAKGYRSQNAKGPARPAAPAAARPVRIDPFDGLPCYDGPADPFEGLVA